MDADFELKSSDISKIVMFCIKEALEEQDDDEYPNIPDVTTSTRLMGKSGILDSNALVSSIVSIEENLAEVHDVYITIADERAMLQEKSPFVTVGSLVEYIMSLIKEQQKNG